MTSQQPAPPGRLRGHILTRVAAAAATITVGLIALPALMSPSQATATLQPAVEQAPALLGAQSISANDRVYTADQTSNTVSVIDPSTNTVLGTIPLGAVRLDVNADVLGAMYNGEIDVHGLGFSRDGRYLDVIDVTTNAAHVIDTASNKVLHTVYLGRAPHEGFFSPDGKQLWVAVRGQQYVAVIDWRKEQVVGRIPTEDGPSKVVFSPDGHLAYVNHLRADALDVIDVGSHKIVDRVQIPVSAGGSSDEAVSPDGKEVWLGMPNNDVTTVVNVNSHHVAAVLNTGPRTNHPNFVTVGGIDYAYVTVGGLNQTLVYRRSARGGAPTLVKRIGNHGYGSHGIWPSPDNTRMYVALQNSDSVDVIDTRAMEVIKNLPVGQSPMALVYVARSGAGSTTGLSRQGLGMHIVNLPIDVQGVTGTGTATVRALPGLDEITINSRDLVPGHMFTVYAARGNQTTALMLAASSGMGVISEALAYTQFFANHYDKVILRPASSQ